MRISNVSPGGFDWPDNARLPVILMYSMSPCPKMTWALDRLWAWRVYCAVCPGHIHYDGLWRPRPPIYRQNSTISVRAVRYSRRTAGRRQALPIASRNPVSIFSPTYN